MFDIYHTLDPQKVLILEIEGQAVADPGGLEAQDPLTLLKLVRKRWPPHGAASFASHQTPLVQISGSATVKSVCVVPKVP